MKTLKIFVDGVSSREHWLHGTWHNMCSRCHCKTNKSYRIYGGRGITVCDDWRGEYGFRHFAAYVLKHMGRRPEGMSMDRINNNGNYEPGNLRWADRSTQARNSTTAKLTAHDVAVIRKRLNEGETEASLAREYGVASAHMNRIHRRLCWIDVPPLEEE